MGFRAPGYQVTARVLQVLEDLGMEYDSSAFWSVLHPAMRLYRRFLSGRPAALRFSVSASSSPSTTRLRRRISRRASRLAGLFARGRNVNLRRGLELRISVDL